MTHDELTISSFILRVFQNPDAADGQPWRIKVTHVQDESSGSFTCFEEAVDFIKRQLEGNGDE